MTPHDIKLNIEVGKQIFENVPDNIKPGWAGLILSRFNNYINPVPTFINELYSIIDNEENWGAAHKQFSKIRQFLLDHKNYKPEAYLLLAENVAKVTYNASNKPASFDNDSGWWISSCALQAASFYDDTNLEEEVKSTILIFNQNTKLKENLRVAKEFIIYKRIDDILWFDWDPLGVKGIAPRDEYLSYVPEIYSLKKSGKDRHEIAKRLLNLERENMGMVGTIEKCLIIADKVIQA